MSPATAFLVGQMIGAGLCSVLLIAIGKYRWALAPFAGLLLIWGLGYWLATS